MSSHDRGIAQLVEHRSPKPGVVSSNLTAPAKKKPPFKVVFFCNRGGWLRTHEGVSLTRKTRRVEAHRSTKLMSDEATRAKAKSNRLPQ